MRKSGSHDFSFIHIEHTVEKGRWSPAAPRYLMYVLTTVLRRIRLALIHLMLILHAHHLISRYMYLISKADVPALRAGESKDTH